MPPLLRAFVVLVCVAGLAPAWAASELDQTLERIFGAKPEFDSKRFGPAKWRNGGASYTTLEATAEKAKTKDLVRYDTQSGQREVLLAADRFTPPGANAKPLTVEDYAWSADGRWLLVFTNAQKVWRQKTRGDYWVHEVARGTWRKLGGNATAATLMFAKFSPDGTRVAYVREHNLYVEDARSGAIKQLTKDGSRTVINGMGDWVSEEELDIRDAYHWSDDGRSIAYWQFDTAGVGEYTLVNTTTGTYPKLTQFPYPKTGTKNSAVRIGVVAASGGRTRWLKLPGDPREHYVARLEWMKDTSQLAVHRLNRLQNTLDVYLADARTGDVRPLWQDRDEAWVSVRESTHWTRDGRTLLILSDRSGWQQAYAVSRADGSTRLLTPRPADVVSLVGPDAKDEWLYYVASPDNATQRYLYRSRLDGSGTTERVTPADQPGTHSYVLSPDGQFAFHTYSSFDSPPVTRLVRLPSHEVIRPLEENNALREKLKDRLRPTEFLSVPAGDGVVLDGWMIKPPTLDPARKYPVIVFIYGENAGVTVTDAWGGSRMLFHRALADAGFVVLSLDNRATPAPKGRAWRKVSYGRVNSHVAAEQSAALKHLLRERPYLDGSRVGVWGHSGGGSNTLNLLFRAPDVYHVGVALAPVTDQRLYDSIYQERYMGLPDQNPDGYREGSPLTHAAGLKGKLLLVHGAADDNVHFQHSEKLIERLVELQKPFDLMVYPVGTHAISEGKGYNLHRYRLIARYFTEHLAASAPTAGRPSP